MTIQWVSIRVDDGSFVITDDGEIAAETLDFGTGLVGTMDVGAMVSTGIHTGQVKVCAATTAGPPQTGDFCDWDDVVEASVYAPHGDLRVSTLYFGPVVELPALSHEGPGWYRLRVCARGRDTAPSNTVQSNDAERYSLVCWPAPRATPLIIRATDRTGQGLRAGAVHEIDAPDPPVPNTPDPQAELRRQNILKAMRKPD
ncbi:hypothetical protein ACH427_19085 [Streptomyces sp. NPDC020379]|uniref:hypothetical protein n=1 Tax=Streptomyces sp. NPDC020379 TaxID=3365071 RepID=UPI0037B42D64